LILLGILSVSCFLHLWNLDGFPSIYRDEDHYLRKAMYILEGKGFQEGSNDLISIPSNKYDHPYFGQIFISSYLWLVGYPQSLNLSTDINSISSIYHIPRILMGLLAVLDTYLIYKIGQIRYNRNIGLLSAAIFAVVPMTWLLRRIWLEPIQLPFILSSLLFAIYLNKQSTNDIISKYFFQKKLLLSIFSGIFLGISIFTKLPAFTFIPLVACLIFSKGKKNLKYLAIWSIPVILIPLIWPANAIYLGELGDWFKDLFWQSERSNAGIVGTFQKLFIIDPIFITISFVSIGFAAIKKDFFIILGVMPFMIFSYFIGYVSYWHLIPVIPFLSLSLSLMIFDLAKRFFQTRYNTLFQFIFILSIIIPSFIISTNLIISTTDDFHFRVISAISREVENFNQDNINNFEFNISDQSDNGKLTILGTNYWLWIPKYIFDKGENFYKNYFIANDIKTDNIMLVAGENFIKTMTRENNSKANVMGLREIYSQSDVIFKLDYSYMNIVYQIITFKNNNNDSCQFTNIINNFLIKT
jgi:hypothetical protein